MTQFKRLPHFSTIVSNDPWNPDHLNRKPIADQLTKLITSFSQPYVLSINSPWGTGKTEFLRRWRADLENHDYACIHFDAWSNDFAEDPFFAFMGEIKKYVDEITSKDDDSTEGNDSRVKTAWDNLIKIGGNFLEKSPKHLARFLTYQAFKQGIDLADFAEDLNDKSEDSSQNQGSTPHKKTLDDAATMISGITAEVVSDYQKKQEYRKNFREALTEFAHSLKTKGKKSPLIILVDELDRCRPDYALELLERIKHLFYADDVVFILAVDETQLCNTISTVYGQGIRPEVYLRKFIDIEFSLPTPSCSNFFDYLSAKFDMQQFVGSAEANDEHYSKFKELFVSLSKALRLSLRDQAQIMTRLSIIFRVYKEEPIVSRLITSLIMMSFHDARLDKIFLDKEFKSKHFTEFEIKIKAKAKFENYSNYVCNSSLISKNTMAFLATAFEYLHTPDDQKESYFKDMKNPTPLKHHNLTDDDKIQLTRCHTARTLFTKQITTEHLCKIIEMSEAFSN